MNRVYVLVGVILIVSGCASGSGIVSGQKHHPIDPSQVNVLPKVTPNHEVLGVIDARVIGMTSQSKQDDLIEELKRQAAAIGANGIVLKTSKTTLYTKMDGNPSGSGMYMSTLTKQTTLSATAIYVNP